MPEIRILSDRVANQIAAGEVVERPAAVAKELIENSIDAGAKKIEIEFRNGGKSYLRVEDDGKGMNSDQALLSLERHATSKIRQASDLNEIQTFGFRGEALPSISSVSRFVLRTRRKSSSTGNEIFVNGGKMIHVKECGMPPGTRIEVSHLFNSVPGRRKFLKTEATESTHIIHLSKLYALAHPRIEFTLMESGRTIFRSPCCEDAHERVREIFGKTLAESLTQIFVEKDAYQLSGLIGKPGQTRSTRKEMIFFVNRRPVESKTMTYAVLEAYHTYAPKGRFPPAILFLNIEPEKVDVNVHPAKREIKFRDEGKVRGFLIDSILSRNRELSSNLEIVQKEIKLERDQNSGRLVPQMDPVAFEIHKKVEDQDKDKKFLQTEDLFVPRKNKSSEIDRNISDSDENSNQLQRVGKRDEAGVAWRFVDQSHGNLAVFSTSEGIVFFHLGAAYERIVFEQMEEAFKDSNITSSQSLLFPESLELDGIDQKNLLNCLDQLRSVGFILEEFGRNFFRIEGCPHWLDPETALQFLKDFLEIARESGGDLNPEKFSQEALIRMTTSQRVSQKRYSDQEIIRLAETLLSCKNPYICPKGKPTFYEVPKRDMENKLQRKL